MGNQSSTSTSEERRIALDEGESAVFYDKSWKGWPKSWLTPRLNPPKEKLPLPFENYGQPFYKGYDWEKKV